MTPREELEALRRLAELEAKARGTGGPAVDTMPKPDPSAGGGTFQFGPLDTGIRTPEWLDRGLAGAGKAFSDIGTGVAQVFGQGSRANVAETRRLDAPLMATTAGTVGNIAGNVAAIAPTAMIPGANTMAGATAIGGLAGLAQPSASTGETVGNVLLGSAGGAAGQAIANKIGSVARNSTSQLTQGQQAAAAGGQSLGMRLTPGKASGSAALQKIEAALESKPITSGGFNGLKENNQKVLNRAAANFIGEKADEVSTPVLAQAEARLGAVFDSVKDKTPVPLDPVAVGGRLRQIAADADGMLNNNASLDSNGLWKQLDNFVNNQGGATREQLRNLSSNLGKKAKQEMTSPMGDRALGESLFAAQEVVEDAIQGTLSASQRAAYNEARNQYRNLMLLTSRTGAVNPSSGNVSHRTLANALMTKDRAGFTMGRNDSDLYKALRFTQGFPDIVGDSGTATRSMGATDWLMQIPGSVATSLYLSRPVAAAAGAGAGAAGTAARLANNTLLRVGAMPVGVVGGVNAANGLANLLQQ